jgi:hypothetical protein
LTDSASRGLFRVAVEFKRRGASGRAAGADL